MLALGDGRVRGPLNGVAPEAVSNARFMSTVCALSGLASVVRQPSWLLHSRFGASALAVTQGRDAIPARALELGYDFRQPALEPALRQLLAA
jgi:NAD dependent epimerase/dehydratase family enzyme